MLIIIFIIIFIDHTRTFSFSLPIAITYLSNANYYSLNYVVIGKDLINEITFNASVKAIGKFFKRQAYYSIQINIRIVIK